MTPRCMGTPSNIWMTSVLKMIYPLTELSYLDGGKTDWLVSFNTPKTNLVIFHHQADAKPAPILVSDHTLKEDPRLESLLGL